jgi:N-acetylmuramoyl-L-alanine amidase
MALLLIAAAAQAGDILGIRVGQTSAGARIVFDLSAPIDHRAFLLNDPPRLVIDLTSQKWATAKSRHLSNSVVSGYRSGQLDNGLTRVVFDLRQKAIIERTGLLPKTATASHRLVIDMERSSDNIFQARLTDVFGNTEIRDAAPGQKNTSAALPLSGYAKMRNESVSSLTDDTVKTTLPARKPPFAAVKKKRVYKVILDAGHGGEDPGAVAADGIREKNITLSVARILRDQLEETGRYKVVMTRNKDVYVRLRDRLRIARENDGDLFISLHADKIGRSNVRGASIYTLSEKASDDETERLAESENNAGVVAGVDLSAESQDVANILLDLAMREKVNESVLLSRLIGDALRAENIRLLPNSHRSAGFAVLKAPDIPAVLIEIGFLSNPQEARLLTSRTFQTNISRAILKGVDAYFRKMESLQKL